MIPPAFIPAAGIADGSCVCFARVIARLREGSVKGDERAAFALAALCVIQPTINVGYWEQLVDIGGRKRRVRGQLILSANGTQ
jgi:hypothetical protein